MHQSKQIVGDVVQHYLKVAPGLRGVTIYSRWANGHGPHDPDPFVEICAAGEESIVQLAGTTIHELAHVVLGHTTTADVTDTETPARELREVEAESVALLVQRDGEKIFDGLSMNDVVVSRGATAGSHRSDPKGLGPHHPRSLAAGLATGQTRTVAVIVPFVTVVKA